MDDPVAEAVQKFIAAVETRIAKQDARIEEQRVEIRSLTTELLQTRAASIVVPQPVPGKDGESGVDGRGITKVEMREGSLVLSFTDNTEQNVGRVVGIDGRAGVDGKDGLAGKDGTDGLNGKDGLSGKDGERGADGIASREELESLIEARFADVQTRTLADMYEGVWKDGLHKRGATSTWGGSLWLCTRESTKRPGDNNDDYKLIVKRGSDAKR